MTVPASGISGIRTRTLWFCVLLLALALCPAYVNASHVPNTQSVEAAAAHDHLHDVDLADHSAVDHEHQTHGLPVNSRENQVSPDGDNELTRIAALAAAIRDGPREPPRDA